VFRWISDKKLTLRASKVEFTPKLDSARLIDLLLCNNTKVRISRIRIGRSKARVVQSIERIEAKLKACRRIDGEVLVKPYDQFTDALLTNVAPARGVVANIRCKVLVDPIADGVVRGWFVAGAGHLLDPGPRRVA
jgi:hypothetical protein